MHVSQFYRILLLISSSLVFHVVFSNFVSFIVFCRVADDMLARCIQEVSEELLTINDDIVSHVYQTEFQKVPEGTGMHAPAPAVPHIGSLDFATSPSASPRRITSPCRKSPIPSPRRSPSRSPRFMDEVQSPIPSPRRSPTRSYYTDDFESPMSSPRRSVTKSPRFMEDSPVPSPRRTPRSARSGGSSPRSGGSSPRRGAKKMPAGEMGTMQMEESDIEEVSFIEESVADSF